MLSISNLSNVSDLESFGLDANELSSVTNLDIVFEVNFDSKITNVISLFTMISNHPRQT